MHLLIVHSRLSAIMRYLAPISGAEITLRFSIT